MKKFYSFLCVSVITSTFLFSQSTLNGTVVDNNGETLPGANILIEGTKLGTTTDIDGNFFLEGVPVKGYIVISFIGYEAQRMPFTAGTSLGTITLTGDATLLTEVMVIGKGIIDIVEDRETPIAVSNIRLEEIQTKLGNQEFPEIMKSTPSVYATKEGGGYGDSRINVRGFNQRNTAVMINGQPVNDMENGWVYWSNWQGLSDIASAIQIQRGLGASKLAVPSVGGTINIITKATERKKGGFAKAMIGNDGFDKYVAAYNTGINEDGWAASVLLSRWQGDGYVDGTEGEGYTYFLSVGYKPSGQHHFNVTFTGATQWHHQRTTGLSIRDYENFGGRKFNADWGYLDGKEYNFRRNFYNKPLGSFNWDWNISDNLSLSSVLYGSWGRGGGTGARGRNFGINPFRKDLTEAIADRDLPYRTNNGLIDFDAVRANNLSGTPYTGDNRFYKGKIIGTNNKYSKVDGINDNIAIRRSSMNSHNWYGGISNLTYEIDKWTFGLGIDARIYTGYHYRVLNDLLGLDGYLSVGNENLNTAFTVIKGDLAPVYGVFLSNTYEAKPFKNTGINGQKIDYYNIGKVDWGGINGIVEYKEDDMLSAVLQVGVSRQSYKRKDYFAYPESNNESDKKTMTGGYVKGGTNYNINDNHNVFFNAGFISKQPIFDAVFPNFSNNINPDAKNEKILSLEVGYGFRSSVVDANVNLYNTIWKDRFIARTIRNFEGLNDGTATFDGIKQVHRGLELDVTSRPIEKLKIYGMLSWGNWEYKDNVTAKVFNEDQLPVDTATLYVDGTKVGDAAQFTVNLSVDYEILKGLTIDVGWYYSNNLYADFSFRLDGSEWANDQEFLNPGNRGALKLPNYHLFDTGLTYTYTFTNKSSLKFRCNVKNVFDTKYIADASSSIYAGDPNPEVNEPGSVGTWKGIDKRNLVWFGFGRTWDIGITYHF